MTDHDCLAGLPDADETWSNDKQSGITRRTCSCGRKFYAEHICDDEDFDGTPCCSTYWVEDE